VKNSELGECEWGRNIWVKSFFVEISGKSFLDKIYGDFKAQEDFFILNFCPAFVFY
jgi:hypothetical protein